MCGIPMTPPPDATRRKRPSFEETLEHIGGLGNFVSDEGEAMLRANIEDYIWKYPNGDAWCTACGNYLPGIRGKHNQWMNCPVCGKGVRFRHEARGHMSIYDQFVLYEWRRSVIDPEGIVLTASHVWRNSGHAHPEEAPIHVDREKIYLFRPNRPVAVYKRGYSGWGLVNNVAPLHSQYGYMGHQAEFVQSRSQFLEALRGTRIGATFLAADAEADRWETLELTAIANCARRPYIEYLAKCGQGALAAELMRLDRMPKGVIRKPRAKNPRELLGLTEGQWYEARRDGVKLSLDLLERLVPLRRMGLGDMRLKDVIAIGDAGMGYDCGYRLGQIAPSATPPGPDASDWNMTIGDWLGRAGVADKLRRKIYRRVIRDLRHVAEWRDYYRALYKLDEDMTDARLLLPRDMMAMHDRMEARLDALRAEERRKADALASLAFEKRLGVLRKDYGYCACGLILRPYESAAEVIAEGKALGICIGSYADRYIKGGTIICCLRRAEEPDVPWRAVEFGANGQVYQDRGYRNDTGGIDPGTRKQLRNFWALWQQAHRKDTRKERASA